LDYETAPLLLFVATAENPAPRYIMGRPTAVVIRVIDINEGPEFGELDSEGMVNRFVGVNTAAGQRVGDPLVALDPEGSAVTFSVSGGDSSFVIDATTGQITTNKVVTGVVGDTKSLVIVAADTSGVQTTQDVVITLVG